MVIMVRPSPTCHGWSHEVCRASVTARGSQYSQESLVLPDGFGVQRVSSLLTSELAVDERERRLQCRRERERARRDST